MPVEDPQLTQLLGVPLLLRPGQPWTYRNLYIIVYEAGVDLKPMPTVGNGVREVRVRAQGSAFRVIYVANLADRVYVLHCFQKRTQQTAGQTSISLVGGTSRSLPRFRTGQVSEHE